MTDDLKTLGSPEMRKKYEEGLKNTEAERIADELEKYEQAVLLKKVGRWGDATGAVIDELKGKGLVRRDGSMYCPIATPLGRRVAEALKRRQGQ